MPLWRGNDVESSKPSWLTEEQKRQCFRTVRGWEIPLAGFSISADAESVFGQTAGNATAGSSSNFIGPNLFRSPTYAGPTELLVCLPLDPSSTGVNQSEFTNRGATAVSWSNGATFGDSINYAPYITSPATGQSFTVARGQTAYIPMIASDANLTDLPRKMVFSLTGQPGTTAPAFTLVLSVTSGSFGPSGASWLSQPTYLIGTTASNQVNRNGTNLNYSSWGGLGGVTAGAALGVFTVTAGATTGTFWYNIRVNDAHTSASNGSLTGSSTFYIVVT